jgi:lipoprotein-anchoring transpeptidase ErfK/SrfK
MRRLVGISSKTQKTLLAFVAIIIALTSIHVAAAARIASLQREQQWQEQTALSTRQPAISEKLLAADDNDQRSAAKSEKSKIIQPSSPESSSSHTAPITANNTAHKRQIVISIADRKLALLEDSRVVKTYPIAVGTRSTPSPDGDFVIINRAKDPIYRHADLEVPPGKDNPLGSRWMGLSLKGYGIHGTNVQSSVGKAASHGCFRMRKQDVEELYTMVHVGDTVTVRRERDAIIAQIFTAPAAEATVLAKSESAGDVQVASAPATTVETAQE